MAEGYCKYILILNKKFKNGFFSLKDLKRDFLLQLNMAFVWTEWVKSNYKESQI